MWVATAGADGTAHLVPVSLCWHRQEILLATRRDRPLARDIAETRRARLGLGDGDDVVLVDAAAEAIGWTAADAPLRDAFVRRVGWDPGRQPGDWVLLRVTPQSVRVWQTVEENLEGSQVMRDGRWIG